MAPELDIHGILLALVEEGVEFLLIGGVAVGFHGFVRGTKDVDVVPAPDPANLTRLSRALEKLDAKVEGVGIGDDALWEKLSPAAVEVEAGGLTLRIVDYDGLVALKEQAGRPQDLIDLERLREARGEG